MGIGPERWVLAFDASCETCRKISTVVERACDGRIEVMSLSHDEVSQWREQALGYAAPWAPTLLRVRGEQVRAWTGKAMGAALVRRLGPASSVRVVRALGQLRDAGELTGKAGKLSRAGFLQLAGGIVVAGSLLTAGIASAAPEAPAKGRNWIEKNRAKLPTGYDEFSRYPVAYRRAIFEALAPEAKSKLWMEHFNRFRGENGRLSAGQTAVITQAVALATVVSNFEGEPKAGTKKQLTSLYEDAVKKFGPSDAFKLLASLGGQAAVTKSFQAQAVESPLDLECDCSDRIRGCQGPCLGPIAKMTSGYGPLWLFPADAKH
ncbi:hypothetical protein SAMN05421504_102385 [Amycolatopsis xylanica]|uniref:Uncharacterized protein n=1 Tax=Amycolatopsis xylanica TaxID=589385 RepID=A0A1H2Z582_9PSEU|nr:bacteriocin fulvocin C-related protein [Amycolatopsis xylanica]SDX12633.1 hypothetical protein SAMN05421504_102385 [Amycolatopsis xylanica]